MGYHEFSGGGYFEFSGGRMMRLLRGALVAMAVVGLVAAAPAPGDRDEKFGKGVTLKEATPIKTLFESPEKFVGKTIRIDGVVTAVCAEMGCWMALGESADAKESVRLKVSHDGKIVFPVSAKGKAVSAEGVFVKVSATDKESKEVIKEQAAVMTVSDFSKTYQINTTGAVIK
jgi:hypothetical protein